MAITEQYWKQNYKNFKQKNPNLSKYIEEEFSRNGYSSNLLKEIIILNESSNISKVKQVFSNLENSVKSEDLNGVKTSVDKLDKLIPDSVKKIKISEEDIDKIYETLENENTKNAKNYKKHDRNLNKINKAATYLKKILITGLLLFIVLGFLLIVLLDYLLSNKDSFIYRYNYQHDALKFNSIIKELWYHAIVVGLIYLNVKIIISLLKVLSDRNKEKNKFKAELNIYK